MYKLYLLFITLIVPFLGISQTTVNTYAQVTAISGTTLTIANATATFPTGQAILMQMKDSVVRTSYGNNRSFGNIDNIASAGLSEMVTVSSVSGSTVTLVASPINTYNLSPNARVQLISYPTLGGAASVYTLSSPLTALAWNGNVGGVLAFNVNGDLVLNSNIIVDGMGFRGGSLGANAPQDYTCDPSTYYDNAAGVSTVYYGGKAEGININTTAYTVAKGKLANGAGGGNVDNAGGGGGGNFTAGGLGGFGWTCSPTSNGGGMGGADLGNYITSTRFFMGGGGGGGQQNNGVGTAGANGGGIVMIKANSIQTNSGCSGGAVSISAQGSSAGNSGNDGAGGGGAGGTILLDVNSYSVNNACPLTLNVSGGAGGTVNFDANHGGGGGGGRGIIIFTPESSTPTNIVIASDSGAGGGNSNLTPAQGQTLAVGGSNTALSGGSGVLYSGFTTLPVTLLSFTGNYSNNSAQLNWNTATEINFSRFIVQRAINDESNFTNLGTLDAKGNNSSYNFSDDLSFITSTAIVYYRLAMVDLDGTVQYSNIISLKVGGNSLSAKAYPVPAYSSVNISMNIPASLNSLQVVIYDMQGRAVKNFGMVPVTAGSPMTLSLGGLAAGQYIAQLSNGEYSDRAVIIKL